MPSKNFKALVLVGALIFFKSTPIHAQDYPEIPNQLSFGGITVNFDRSAQNLIEEDVKSLMSNKKFWEEKMDRAILYFPIVESILMDEEVPIDFKYLAVQESSFKPDVISSSNAVGYWQFKPETAIGLNLRVDENIDERKNISSSTHAAAWYLKKNYQQFNNWVSTLYSYYLGAGGVKKVVPANWPYAREITLTGKTDRYMLRFFAHKIALEAGLDRYKGANKIVLMESDYGKGLSLDQIARGLDLNAQDLTSYNRWLNQDKIPTDGEYLVLLPIPFDKIESVRQKLSIQIAPIANNNVVSATGYPILKRSGVQSKEKDAPIFYDINGLPGIEARPGDRPKTLAKAGNLRTPKFLRNNDMIRDMPLIPGKVYYLARKNKKAATPFHTAQPGDTWQSVSQQYAVRLVNLLKYNRTLSRNYPIQTGQVLWLTEQRPRKTPVEIKYPNTPGVDPAKQETVATTETEKQASDTTPVNEVPTKSSGRKRYKPVLVDKSTTEPEKTAPVTESKKANQPYLYKNSKDRVVIISQETTEETSRTTPDGVKTTQRKTDTPIPAKPAVVKATPALPDSRTNSDHNSTGTANEFHTVEKGQTYFSISKINNISVKELLELNGLEENDKLSVGQKLRVQKAPVTAVSNSIPTTSRNAQSTVIHTVVSGETLFRISKMYEVDMDDIKSLNNISGNSVQLGQKIKIPQKK